VQVGELPLNMGATPDENYVIVNNNGTAEHSLTVIETSTWTVIQRIPISKYWLGLKFTRDGRRLIVSGGNDNRILVYAMDAGHLTLTDSISLGAPRPTQRLWVAGLDVDDVSGRVFVVGRESDSLYVVNLARRSVDQRLSLGAKPYTCLLARDRSKLFVSLWGGSAVAVVSPSTLTLIGTVKVGDHPCDMVESPDGKRLFVANANHNSVSVVDISTGKVIETITTSLTPTAPFGSTPNGVALNQDGTRLYVANADNNYLAVLDVSTWQNTRSLGLVPTGWYPTSVLFLRSSKRIVVANGKGISSRANIGGPIPSKKRNPKEEYIGSLFKGTAAAIDDPDGATLHSYTRQVYMNSPYTDSRRDTPGQDPGNPVPPSLGGSSPIKHVFYIIKENRTYDQVFGDVKEGNGDRDLCLFPDQVTPNHHALVRQFVLLDNIYCDAEVSADGHNWSMGAYATDYVEKSWPTSYGGRGGEYEFEGGYPHTYPSNGFLWDNCQRHGVTYRNYGEWADTQDKPGDTAKALMPSLEGHVAPHYRGWDLSYSDVDRYKAWLKEFDRYDVNGELPQFQILKLPNDHTQGTKKGSLTPRAYVAQNDLALGLIVERISRSRYWKESAIFVIEDDAQNGPDHVDAHRTVALVISPWTKQGFVDSELYSTSSVVRTMELILGLPPLSQFDAAATPMFNSFASTSDLRLYAARPANVDITERNPDGAVGQERSNLMDFSSEDRIPDVEFSEIIWKAIKGVDSQMPAPVRSASVRSLKKED
jgi:YVTN family beta-propeller protein